MGPFLAPGIIGRPRKLALEPRMPAPELRPAAIHYPESDGKPMAETDVHRDLMVDLIAALAWRFRDDPEFYVSGNLFVYYQEGDAHKVVAPDVFVVRGVPKRRRRIYKVWDETKGPDLVIELTSASTDVEDRGNKRAVYEELGVKEYFIFDPEAARTRFTGFSLKDGFLVPAPPTRAAGDLIVYASAVLGLELHGRRSELRWVDPATEEALPIPRDAYEQSSAALELAERERERAEREHEIAKRERERAEQGHEIAERERERAEREHEAARRERERADQEKARADRLEAELKKLRG
jgi:Uma2 family endonuclease